MYTTLTNMAKSNYMCVQKLPLTTTTLGKAINIQLSSYCQYCLLKLVEKGWRGPVQLLRSDKIVIRRVVLVLETAMLWGELNGNA